MADETRPAVGMSIGATTLAAVTAERAVTRKPVLTLFRNRSSRIGVSAENPDLNVSADESGLTITDFVDRVGDSEPVVATDGSTHRAEQLLADGLHALAYAVTEGRPIPPAVAVAYPGHWSADAVEVLQAALGRVPEWLQHPVSLMSDVAASVTALQANPGLPATGIMVVCDFGGSGTSVTLVDAADGNRPVDRTRRYPALSGETIDQVLLDHVITELAASSSSDDPPAVGSLKRVRGQCRTAKEQLSVDTAAELPGFPGGVWLTRAELDEAIRQPLDGFYSFVQQALDDNRIQAADISAVISVGGGANIPAITAGLSQRFGVPVITSPRPQLTAAIGAALAVSGGPVVTTKITAPPFATASVPPVPPVGAAAPPVIEITPPAPPVQPLPATPPAATPQVTTPSAAMPPPARANAEYRPADAAAPSVVRRRPLPVILGVALAALLVGIVSVIALRHAADSEPAPATVTTETSPAAPEPSTTQQPLPTLESPPPESPLPEPGQEPAFTEAPPIPESPPGPEPVQEAPQTPPAA